MSEARKAAKRMKNITRVFVIEKVSDLKKQSLKKQIELDLASGIKVHLCLWKDIKREVPEPDFGVWDNDYLCTVRFSKNKKKINEVEMDSRAKRIKIAKKWKQKILKKSQKVEKIDDIRKFIAKKSP